MTYNPLCQYNKLEDPIYSQVIGWLPLLIRSSPGVPSPPLMTPPNWPCLNGRYALSL